VTDGRPEGGRSAPARAGEATSGCSERTQFFERLVDRAAADVAMEEIPDLFSGEAVFGGLQSLEDAIGVSDSNDIHLLSLTASLRNAIMAVVTVRNLPEETHRALRMQAARHGRSTEAEIRAILQRAVQPEVRTRIGQQLAAFGKKHGGLDLEVDRDPRSTEAADFG
jgi:plasmid stability protein